MKIIRLLHLVLLFNFFVLSVSAQENQVRIAIVGNSITEGTGLPDPDTQSYPAQLSEMLQETYGDTCLVQNVGVSGTTMLKNGDYPLWETPTFENGLNFAPNICVILLGTNDSKPQNWDNYADEFLPDYLSMIDTFQWRNPNTQFFVCYPPPAYEVVFDIRDSVIVNGVIPMVDSVLSKTDARLIDFYTPLEDSVDLFPDKIHPDEQGAKVMAEIIYDRFIETDVVHQVETGFTFVTGLRTSRSLISDKDSAELSWTTVNADSVWLDGALMTDSGSLYVSPDMTTKYRLFAKGTKSSNSMDVTLEVYQPELTNLRIIPSSPKGVVGEGIELEVIYTDQHDRQMTDTDFDLTWNILEGEGNFVSSDNSGATFEGTAPGTALVQAAVGNISADVEITVEGSTSTIDASYDPGKVIVFPNPFHDQLNIYLNSPEAGEISIKLYDIQGKMHQEKHLQLKESKGVLIPVNTKTLPEGLYVYEIKYLEFTGSGRVVKY